MDPLAFIAAILGATGLGAILKIVLSATGRSQEVANKAAVTAQSAFTDTLQKQRDDFEGFLGNHMQANREALANLVHATERLGDDLSAENRETRDLMREQARVTRDGHIKMAQLLQARQGTAETGRVLDEVMRNMEELGK